MGQSCTVIVLLSGSSTTRSIYTLVILCSRGVFWLGIRTVITWIFLFATKINPMKVRHVYSKRIRNICMYESFSRFFFGKFSHMTLRKSIMINSDLNLIFR